MKLHVILSLITLAVGAKVKRQQLDAIADKTESGSERETRRAWDASKLAVLISGVEDSFNWAHAVDRVITPAARQGFSLDFFIRLVASGRSNGAQWSSVKNETGSGVDVQAWKRSVMATGKQAAGSENIAGTDQRDVDDDADTDQSEPNKERSSHVDIDLKNTGVYSSRKGGELLEIQDEVSDPTCVHFVRRR